MKSNFIDRLNLILNNKNISQTELSKRTGITQSTISDWVRGKSTPRQDKIDLLAQALGVSPSYLMGWDEESRKTIDLTKFPNISPISVNKLPLLGEIACGKPIFANEDRESYVEIGTDIKADFCLKCKGDSMINARIFDGDIVFIKAQPSVENGNIAAVIIENEVTLKRIFYYPETNTIELRPENPMYKSFIFRNSELEQINILGKAIAFQGNVI